MQEIGVYSVKSCPEECYSSLMMTQLQIYRHHIGTCLQLANPLQNKQELLTGLIHKFGFTFRKFYCSFVCDSRYDCSVRSLPAFNINEVYEFNSLSTFPCDFSLGTQVLGCHFPAELNAMQLFLVNDFFPGDNAGANREDNAFDTQEIRQKQQAFLDDYGSIFQQMFCSTICPQRTECKKGNHCLPQQYA